MEMESPQSSNPSPNPTSSNGQAQQNGGIQSGPPAFQGVPPPPPPVAFNGGPPPLPPGWTEHKAPSGQLYYYNASTKASTYTRPMPPPPPPSMSLPPPPMMGPPPAFNGPAPGFNGFPPGPPPMGGGPPFGGWRPPPRGVHPNQNRPPYQQQQQPPPKAPTGPAAMNGGGQGKKPEKDKPLKKQPIGETGWLKVTTVQGNVFFTNKKDKTSVWEVPEEIKEEVGRLEAEEKEREEAERKQKDEQEASSSSPRGTKRKAENEDDDGAGGEVEEGEGEGDEPVQKKKKKSKPKVITAMEDLDEEWQRNIAAEMAAEMEQQESDKPVPGGPGLQTTPVNGQTAMASPGGVQLQVTDQNLSLEEAKALYKTMLSETPNLNPMSPWDMELPKFINDKRYSLIKNLKDRRDLFDEWCKDTLRERRAAKREKEKQGKIDPAQGYRNLLIEKVSSTRTHWEDFKSDNKKDGRFREFGKDDREREKGFKNWLKELGERKRADAKKAEERFVEMLKESRRIEPDTDWKQIKSTFSSDPRYSAVTSSSTRESLFKSVVDSLKTDTSKSEADRKREKQEASLREREVQVRKEQAGLEKQTKMVKGVASREEGEIVFNQLLMDAVRDDKARWSDVLQTIQQDPRFSSANLNPRDQRNLFDRHIDSIKNKRLSAIESVFENKSPGLDTPFSTIWPDISSNPSITRIGSDKHRIEDLYEIWQTRRKNQAKGDFEQLLGESAFVDFWGRLRHSGEGQEGKNILEEEDDEEMGESAVDLKAMASTVDLKEIHSVLKHDKRYRVWDFDPEKRERWMREYLEKLGAPKATVHQRST